MRNELSNSEDIFAVLAFYIPLGIIWWLSKAYQYKQREWVAVTFSGTWLIASIIFLTTIGESLGYWTFRCNLMEKMTITAVWISWWLCISQLPIIFNKKGYQYCHSILIAVGAYLLDLVIMPLLSKWITLHESWQWADLVVCLCLYTSVQITRTTIRKSTFYKRNLFLGFTLIILTFWAPVAILLNNPIFFLELNWLSIPTLGLAVGFAIAHQGAWEFAHKGKGTPFPLDPPIHLVTTGIYAHVRNPMQTGFLIASISWGYLINHWAMLFLPIGLLVYSVGFCKNDEEADLTKKFGKEYKDYLKTTRNWWIKI